MNVSGECIMGNCLIGRKTNKCIMETSMNSISCFFSSNKGNCDFARLINGMPCFEFALEM